MYGATLSEALVLYESALPEIRENLITNMRADIAKIPGPKRGDTPELVWVRTALRKLMIERATERPMRSLKRIMAYLEAKEHPEYAEGRITDMDIVRAREVPIQELYDGRLRGAGAGRLAGLCPFHAEKRASFIVTTAPGKHQNKFHCFGCGEHGDSIDFTRKMYGLDFIAAVRKLI